MHVQLLQEKNGFVENVWPANPLWLREVPDSFAIPFAMLISLVYLTYRKMFDRVQGHNDTKLVLLRLHIENNIFRVSAKGDPVVYTNWMPGRMSIFHNNEDCVGLGVHAYQGHWEDLTCHMELHYICEFGKLLFLGISTCRFLCVEKNM